MPYIPNEALTREQGEQIIDVLKGEEPKEYGYPYTNEVLNKEQGDRIIKALKNFHPSGDVPTPEASDVGKVLGIVQEEGTIKYKPVEGGSGGGMPDPSELETGTAPVVVDGEWKMQEGYGWVGEELEKATSDYPLGPYCWYRVADVPELPSDFGVGSYCTIRLHEEHGGEIEEEYGPTQIDYAEEGIYSCLAEEIPYYVITTEDNVSMLIEEIATLTFGTAGVYFMGISYDGVRVFVNGLGFGNDTREMAVTWDGVTKTGKKIDGDLLPDSIGYEEPSKLSSDIYWDGDTEGRDAFIMSEDVGAYKVSEYIDPNSFVGAELTLRSGYDESSTTISQEYIIPYENGLTLINDYIFISEGPTEIEGITIPSGGVYFMKEVGDYETFYVSSVVGKPIIHKIDPKYLPEIIPPQEYSDSGKVLTANGYGGVSWESSSGLPASYTSGQVLKSGGPGSGPYWDDITYVPDPSFGTPGQVLKVSNYGTAYWMDESGGLPSGGSEGNVLKKTSSGVAWENVNEVPSGGSEGNVLKKTSSGVAWENEAKTDVFYQIEEPSSSKDGDIWIEFTPNYLCFTALENNSSVEMTAIGNAPSVSLEYSLDRKIWQVFIVDETTMDLDAGEKVYLRGNNNSFGSSLTDYNKFVMSGKIKSSGNVMTLFNFNNGAQEFYSSYSCCNMFYGCTSLVTAPELPATTLSLSCYYQMFYGCTSLVTAPELPATTLSSSCYWSMFQGCTSLVTAPELPATTLASECYKRMFNGCTSLVTAPELPATTLAYFCYQTMFQGCTSLVTAPELPATTLDTYCYESMFYGCTSLVTAPELPATTLSPSCYMSMFYDCTSLVTTPELPATALANRCYESMFRNCTSLVTAPELPATTLASNCYSNMFNGCTSLVTAPELPATALANRCYEYMFRNCTSLVTAPELPATILEDRCYYYMFLGCVSLNYIKVAFVNWLSEATWSWLPNNVGTFACPAALDTSMRDEHHIPSNWNIVTV